MLFFHNILQHDTALRLLIDLLGRMYHLRSILTDGWNQGTGIYSIPHLVNIYKQSGVIYIEKQVNSQFLK